MKYCKDCKKEVKIYATGTGDPGVINGTQEIIIWRCQECGGENITETKQEADLIS